VRSSSCVCATIEAIHKKVNTREKNVFIVYNLKYKHKNSADYSAVSDFWNLY
jgi:hypothetical protein